MLLPFARPSYHLLENHAGEVIAKFPIAHDLGSEENLAIHAFFIITVKERATFAQLALLAPVPLPSDIHYFTNFRFHVSSKKIRAIVQWGLARIPKNPPH